MVEACFLDIKKRGWVLKVCALPLQTYTHTLSSTDIKAYLLI